MIDGIPDSVVIVIAMLAGALVISVLETRRARRRRQ